MPEPVRLQIRCSEDTETTVKAAAARFGMTLGEFAAVAAKFAEANDDDFEQFAYKESRKRDGRD